MKKNFLKKFCLMMVTIIILCTGGFLAEHLIARKNITTVRIAIVSDPLVENYSTNYYTEWLKNQTGYNIEFTYFTEGYEKEYLRALLFDTQGGIDAVFFPAESEIVSFDEFDEYVRDGYICDLSEFATPSSNITALRGKQPERTEAFYYLPHVKNSKQDMITGILWINTHWLSSLSLRIPQTYAELETVLQAFLENDPNGNGIADEIPLISGYKNAKITFDAFVQYSMENAGRAQEYCNRLRSLSVLSDECMNFSNRQVREVVNSPDDCVGAFVSNSISDYVYPNGSDVISRFTAVPPLFSETAGLETLKSETAEQIGGFIPENAFHKKEAFEIMDLMLSEEASLIAAYGEKDVDYRYSIEGELSAYGNKAEITTINYLGYSLQNKNFRGAGPMNLSQIKSDEVKWQGEGSYVEYMDARAVRLYEKQANE